MQKDEVILVVDDDPKLCQAVALVLAEAGYPAEMAFGGDEALKLLYERPFHLILADIEMPYLNGYQLLLAVRRNPDWQRVPLIFLSGRKLDSDVRFGKQLGADDYLVKPLNVPDLLATVEGKLHRFRGVETAEESIPGMLEMGRERPFSAPNAPHTAPNEFQCRQIGSLRINLAQHRVWLEEELIILSAREFALLRRLSDDVDHVISPQELIKATHDFDIDNQEAGGLIRPLIRTLRRRLGEHSHIENVRGVGYRLLSPT